MQPESLLELSKSQNLIITLLRKAKPELQYEIIRSDAGIPELVMEYGIVTNMELVVKEPRKYKIPLDELATWVSVKKMVDFFEKYLKNVNLNNSPIDISPSS
jgi:hypothetical protein